MVEGDTLVVTHIDRLSRGLIYGLQVIEGLHRAGVEFRSLSEDFDTSTPTGKLQLTMGWVRGPGLDALPGGLCFQVHEKAASPV